MKRSMQAEALRYARAGYRVFPVRAGDKVPLTAHGVHDATSDERRIAELWNQHPNANIGLATEGLVVVDVDPRNGGNVEALPRPLPDTCIAHTGGGGLHYLYRAHNGTKYPGKLAEGIDLKSGAGSYVVVAPSVHATGRRYQWKSKCEPWRREPSVAPQWIATAAIDADLRERARARTQARAATKFGQGERNERLASLAGKMRSSGASADEMLVALHAFNAARCVPPLPDSEVRGIAASIAKYARGTKHAEWPPALDLKALARLAPAKPQFIMPGTPAGYATGLYGHGGAGKSHIALLLAASIALGAAFCGLPVQRRRVLYLACEDRASVLHARLAHICCYLKVGMESLHGWLSVIDLVGHDAVLFTSEHGPTSALALLAERIDRTKSEVVFLDGLADVFGGNENVRTEAKRFINPLVGLLPPETGAAIVIGHIDKASARSDSKREAYSGSTGWWNSFRSVLMLPPETRGDERTGKLILEVQKSNHGEVGTQIAFEWSADAHMFVGQTVSSTTPAERAQQEAAERAGVLGVLRVCAWRPTSSFLRPRQGPAQRTT